MIVKQRMKMSLLCLSLLASSACASSAPISMPSFSERLERELAAQKADDCAQLKPRPLPEFIRPVLVTVPEDPAQQTPEQRALMAWLNHAAAAAQNHLSYCKEN